MGDNTKLHAGIRALLFCTAVMIANGVALATPCNSSPARAVQTPAKRLTEGFSAVYQSTNPTTVAWSYSVWEQRSQGNLRGVQPVFLQNGTVVFGTSSGEVLWMKDGRIESEFSSGATFYTSPGILSDETVVINNIHGDILWLSGNGPVAQKLGSFNLPANSNAQPLILNDDTVIAGSSDGNLYWLCRSGSDVDVESLPIEPGRPIRKLAIDADGNVIVATSSGHLYWVARNRGITARLRLHDFEISAGPTVMPDGRVVVIADQKVIWIKDHSIQHSLTYDLGYGRLTSDPAVIPGTHSVVFGTGDGQVIWMNDGTIEHALKLEGALTYDAGISAAGAVFADGTAIFGAANGKLYWVKAGAKLNEFQSAGDIEEAPAIDQNGRVFFGTSAAGTVYLLNE